MDFEYHYTAEQEAFRKEVSDWLDAHLPPDWPRPHFAEDNAHISKETFAWMQDMRRKMGEKGWLYPTWPKEYGGGGLTAEHDVVLQEEMAKRRFPLAPGASISPGDNFPGAAMVWGTEEQKQTLLRPILEGRRELFQLFTEPSAGSDLASLKTRAVRDGDDWLITGEKVFVGSHHGYRLRPEDEVPDIHEEVDEMYTLVVTDPDAPRHRNLGYFLIPANTPGITFHPLDLLTEQGKLQIYLDNVRVPHSRLIGAPGQGWQVAQTSLELEHGGSGDIAPRDHVIDALLAQARESGKARDPHLKHNLMDAYIDVEVRRLFGWRNYWMHTTGQEMVYHGSQNSLWRKEAGLRVADQTREVLGLYALLDEHDPRSRFWGELENHQRESLVRAHPGGTIEVQKVIMARRLGVSRTKERAAPTPSTSQS